MSTFFSKVEAFFKKVFTKIPSWTTIASAALTYVAPITETIVSLTAGEAAAAEIEAVVETVKADLAVAAVTAQGIGNASSMTGALASIQTNLQSLLTAGQIKNPATLAKVTTEVNTIIAEIKAIQSAIPAGS